MSEPTTVLVAEDDTSSREIMVRLLERSGFRVLAATDGAEAVRLMSPEVHVALLDWMMPEMDGLAVCRLIKASPETTRTYVIMVTSKSEKSDTVAALDAGADDYMSKPVDHEELLARVRAAERVAQRETSLVSQFSEAQSRADHDELTGLYNRRYFDRQLAHEIEQARRNGGVLSVLLLDIDHFKLVNDLHGHQVGDEVLRQVAREVREQARERSDTVARYGGEELAIIAPDTSPLCATQLAERIRQRVAQLRIPAGNQLVSVTISIGVAGCAGCTSLAADPAALLIEQADARLYQAKHGGRNRVAA